MIGKIIKILLLSSKSYLLFIFIATFLSLFSYILSSNVVLSVDEYLQSQIQPLLGGDVAVYSRQDVIGEEFYEKYEGKLRIAETIETSTTLFDEERKPSLIDLTFINESYPIYSNFDYDIINASGSLIVSQDVLSNFGSQIEIYDTIYDVKGVLQDTPLGNISVFSSSFSVYLPYDEFEKSGLTGDTARLQFNSYLGIIGGYDAELVEQLKSDDLLTDARVRSLEDRNENIGEITDRFSLFLNIFNLIVFVLTFFIIIISLEIFYKNLKTTIGLLSILGLKKSQIFFLSLLSLGVVYIAAFILSSLLNNYAISLLAAQYDFFRVHSSSYLQGVSISLVLLGVGVSSPFFKIAKSNIGSLLSDREAFSKFGFTDYIIYLGLIFIGFFLISIISGVSLLAAGIYSLVCIISIIALYIITRLILVSVYSVIKKLFSPKKYFYFFDAIRSGVRPGNVSFFIVLSSLISFLSIFVFFVFSGSFLTFLDDLTNNSNDTFITNISQDDISVTREYFDDENIFEISAVRIREINGFSLDEYKRLNSIRGGYTREYFLSTGEINDEIVQGSTLGAGGVSIGSEFASELQLRVGDEILFSVAGIEKTLRVQNFREIVRNGTDPFFLLQGAAEDFENLPKRYFVSYDSRQYPEDIQFHYTQAIENEVSIINTRDIVELVLDVAGKILQVVYFCLIYIGIFSFLTFIVSVSFLKTFKTRKLKLLHILGGKKKYLHRVVFIEYSYLVLLGIIMSVIIGTIALLILSHFIDFFDINISSYLRGLALLGILFIAMMIYLVFSKNKI